MNPASSSPRTKPWHTSCRIAGWITVMSVLLWSQYLSNFPVLMSLQQTYGKANASCNQLSGGSRRQRIPLSELVESNKSLNCSNETVYISDSVLANDVADYKIPRTIHMTSKSRCMAPTLAKSIERWRQLDGYSLYFHDDNAVNRLVQQEWPEFPHLHQVLQCLKSKTAIADVWRYLVLWEYGGVYTDIDSAPTTFNASTISPQEDGWFIASGLEGPSQYFMAISPRHPMMYFSVHHALWEIMERGDTGSIFAATTTGPRATKRAFTNHFVKHTPDETGENWVPKETRTYLGLFNRSVTIADEKGKWVQREAMHRNEKIDEYHKMGMTHFFEDRRQRSNHTCLQYMFAQYVEWENEGSRLWTFM